MPHANRFLSLVEAIQPRIDELTCEEVEEKIAANHSDWLLIDVREDREWEAGHVPHAIHIGKGVLERDIERFAADPEQKMILYCGGGYRSILAAEVLKRMGYQNVFSMKGGVKKWLDQGNNLV